MKRLVMIPLIWLTFSSLALAQETATPAKRWLPKGDVVWSLNQGEDQSPILLSDTHAYVHEAMGGGRLQKLNLATGVPIWSVESSHKPLAKLTGVGPQLYLVTETFELICLDSATGKNLWTAPLEPVSSGGIGFGGVVMLRSAIRAIQRVGDTVLVATYGMKFFKGRTGKVYALDAETGKLRWSFEAEYGVENDIIESQGRLYFGGVGAAYAVDLKTGAQLWKAELRSDNQWTFLLQDGLLLVSSGHYAAQKSMSGGTLYALDSQTGQIRWKFDISGPSLMRAEKGVVVGIEWSSFGGSRLTALSLKSGEKLWEYKEKSATSPVVKDGRVVYISKDNRIHVLDLPTGRPVNVLTAAGDFEMSSLTPWAYYFAPRLIEGEVVQVSWAKQTDETVFQRIDVAKGTAVEEFRQKGRVQSVLGLPGRLGLRLNLSPGQFRTLVLE
jgi:outer membrane protein assembly factor BamB